MSHDENRLIRQFIAVGIQKYPDAVRTLDKFREELSNLIIGCLKKYVANRTSFAFKSKFEPGRGSDYQTVFADLSYGGKKPIKMEFGIKWESHANGPAILVLRLYRDQTVFDALSECSFSDGIRHWYLDKKEPSIHLSLPIREADLDNLDASMDLLISTTFDTIADGG